MIQCQNCGKGNAVESNFCRSCGVRFGYQSKAVESNYEYAPPGPYSWKTDEFQVSKPDAQKTAQRDRIQPLVNQMPLPGQNYAPQHLVSRQPGQLDINYHCPRCGSHYLPIVERKISTTGWVVFSVLLVFTFIFFWIGLLMKEEVRICPVCRAKVG
jgi:hypothetical protein